MKQKECSEFVTHRGYGKVVQYYFFTFFYEFTISESISPYNAFFFYVEYVASRFFSGKSRTKQ